MEGARAPDTAREPAGLFFDTGIPLITGPNGNLDRKRAVVCAIMIP
jgi:hypothetical protein